MASFSTVAANSYFAFFKARIATNPASCRSSIALHSSRIARHCSANWRLCCPVGAIQQILGVFWKRLSHAYRYPVSRREHACLSATDAYGPSR
jgi:hypothetical protein